MYENTERPKTGKETLLKPLKLELHNIPKLIKKGIKDATKKINNSSFSALNKYNKKINNNPPSLNSTNNETSLLINNQNYISKINSFSQCHNYFQIIPKLKPKSPLLNKISKNNKLISLKRNKKIYNDEIKVEKDDLILAANKKNPSRLLASIIKIINPDKTLFEKKLKNYSDKNINNIKWLNLKKNNINNKTMEQSNEKNKTIMKIRNYRSKTEKINGDKYGITYPQKNKNITVTKMTESNFFESKLNTEEQKEEINNMNKSQYVRNYITIKIKKKQYADASCDTNLDKLINKNNNTININNNKLNMINNTKIEFDYNNYRNNFNNSFFPKRILYKNNKFFHKMYKKDANNLNISLQKSINCYNFNNIINLFDKKISLENNSKINYLNNFRNRSFKFYSSCNNSNIGLIKREIFKRENCF